MKSTIFSIALVIVALFTFGSAQAQNAHFTDVIVSADGLTISGKVAGLGNAYAGKTMTITYNAEVTVTKVCLTPNEDHQNVVTGQSTGGNGNGNSQNNSGKGNVQIQNTYTVSVTAKNGHVNFTLTLDPASVPVMDCQGRGLVLDVEASSITTGDKTLTFSVDSILGVNKTGTLTL